MAASPLQLFDGLRAVHGLDGPARDYLEAAALLANVGLVISHSKHHLHSYYVIRNSELAGFTDDEIEIIALIARYHRKSEPKTVTREFAAPRPRSAPGARARRHPPHRHRARPQLRPAGPADPVAADDRRAHRHGAGRLAARVRHRPPASRTPPANGATCSRRSWAAGSPCEIAS